MLNETHWCNQTSLIERGIVIDGDVGDVEVAAQVFALSAASRLATGEKPKTERRCGGVQHPIRRSKKLQPGSAVYGQQGNQEPNLRIIETLTKCRHDTGATVCNGLLDGFEAATVQPHVIDQIRRT